LNMKGVRKELSVATSSATLFRVVLSV